MSARRRDRRAAHVPDGGSRGRGEVPAGGAGGPARGERGRRALCEARPPWDARHADAADPGLEREDPRRGLLRGGREGHALLRRQGRDLLQPGRSPSAGGSRCPARPCGREHAQRARGHLRGARAVRDPALRPRFPEHRLHARAWSEGEVRSARGIRRGERAVRALPLGRAAVRASRVLRPLPGARQAGRRVERAAHGRGRAAPRLRVARQRPPGGVPLPLPPGRDHYARGDARVSARQPAAPARADRSGAVAVRGPLPLRTRRSRDPPEGRGHACVAGRGPLRRLRDAGDPLLRSRGAGRDLPPGSRGHAALPHAQPRGRAGGREGAGGTSGKPEHRHLFGGQEQGLRPAGGFLPGHHALRAAPPRLCAAAGRFGSPIASRRWWTASATSCRSST